MSLPMLRLPFTPLTGRMDSSHTPHLLSMQSNPSFWYRLIGLFGCVCSRIYQQGYMLMLYCISDPLYWMRVILASNRGTLMELGITPIVTS
jgi:preprotein translocase subunit SecY